MPEISGEFYLPEWVEEEDRFFGVCFACSRTFELTGSPKTWESVDEERYVHFVGL